nr:phosphoribosylpyrophosphate synthetase [uncultured Flavobacterium sp.]
MQNTQPSFDTVTEAVQWLQAEGFTHDFSLDTDCLRFDGAQAMSPDDFNIAYYFRFEGETDPGDENIVYGIDSSTYNTKGIVVSAFGTYSDAMSDEMLKKLSVR